MQRRAFLGGLAAMGSPAAPPGGIIDTHTHFYDPARPRGVPWPPKDDPVLYRTVLPAEFRALTRPLGVAGTVAIEASPWVEDNAWLLELAAFEPVIVAVVGHLEAGEPEFRGRLERFARNRLFRGIRLGGPALAAGLARRAFLTDLERLADADLSLDVLVGPELLPQVATLARRIPALRIVIDHLPYDVPPRGGLRAFADLPGVYAKVSGVLRRVDGRVVDDPSYYRGALEDLWNVFGPGRVLYGSNWPVSDRVAPYGAVLKAVSGFFAAKGAEAADRFFRDNARAAYRWLARA